MKYFYKVTDFSNQKKKIFVKQLYMQLMLLDLHVCILCCGAVVNKILTVQLVTVLMLLITANEMSGDHSKVIFFIDY